jgi:DNA topoisomerase-1
MRTDSVNIAKEAQVACRGFIASEYGDDYVPAKPNFYKSKASAQEAHEAVRPTDVTLTPQSIAKFLDASQLRLYTLIWNRFVASQMAPALQQRTTLEVGAKGSDSKDYIFRTVATVTTFPGFTKVMKVAKKEGDDNENAPAALAKLKPGDSSFLRELLAEQKFTEPPARFSEATLIKQLEANGIGRPSTYATIVNTIQNRNYVIKDKGRLVPNELGFRVNDFLVASLPNLFQVSFTASMEEQLDEIEAGSINWTEMLQSFYDQFADWLHKAKYLNAPETQKINSLTKLFVNITKWEEPVKVGRRTYDDQKFITSIQEKLEKDGNITEKQWGALLRLVNKYADQIPTLETVAKEGGNKDDIMKSLSEIFK